MGSKPFRNKKMHFLESFFSTITEKTGRKFRPVFNNHVAELRRIGWLAPPHRPPAR